MEEIWNKLRLRMSIDAWIQTCCMLSTQQGMQAHGQNPKKAPFRSFPFLLQMQVNVNGVTYEAEKPPNNPGDNAGLWLGLGGHMCLLIMSASAT